MTSINSSSHWGDDVLIPQPPLPNRNEPAPGSNSDYRVHLSRNEKARRYDRYVVNDKAPANRDAQISDFLDRMTLEPENLFPTNNANLAKFVPTMFKQATVRGTRFDEPPIPFKAPSVQASVNAAEFFIKYNRDNPIGGPYKDKRLYNNPIYRQATQPRQRSFVERLNDGWDALTFEEQQVFRQAGGRWFVENFLQPGTTSNEQREENIDEFIRILNERNTIPNTSDISPLYGSNPPFSDGLFAAPDVPEGQWLANSQEWLQNNLESKQLRRVSAATQNQPSLLEGLSTLG